MDYIIDPSSANIRYQDEYKGQVTVLMFSQYNDTMSSDQAIMGAKYLEAFPNLVVMVYKESEHKINCDYIKPVKQNDIVTVGQLTVEILYTPGHYDDSICYYLDGVLFTGDTLFVGRTGRTISKGSNIKKLTSDFLKEVNDYGVSRLIYTDINKDGTKSSPNFEETEKIAKISNCPVVISGGVSSMEDIKKAKNLNNKNIEGIIVGKAIYDGDIQLEELSKEIDA